MGADGGVGAADFFGDLHVEEPLAEHFEDFEFARGESVGGIAFGSDALEDLDHLPGDAAGHGRAASEDIAHGCDQLPGLNRFDQIADGTGGEGIEDRVGIAMDGKHQNLRGDAGFDEAANGFDAVDAGQVDIHDDDARLKRRDGLQRLFPGAVRTHAAAVVGPVENHGQRAPDAGIVFDYGYGDQGSGSFHGKGGILTSRRTRVPAPGAESTDEVPPISRIRKPRFCRPS